jgi:hypothetical protein
MFELVTDYSNPSDILNAMAKSLPEEQQASFDAKPYIDGFLNGLYVVAKYTQNNEVVGYQLWLQFKDGVKSCAILHKMYIFPAYVKENTLNDFLLFAIKSLKSHNIDSVCVQSKVDSPLSLFLNSVGIQYSSVIYEV